MVFNILKLYPKCHLYFPEAFVKYRYYSFLGSVRSVTLSQMLHTTQYHKLQNCIGTVNKTEEFNNTKESIEKLLNSSETNCSILWRSHDKQQKEQTKGKIWGKKNNNRVENYLI
jgi:hypothetical protein